MTQSGTGKCSSYFVSRLRLLFCGPAGELAQDTVVIHGVVFAGVGEAHKFTDSTVAKTFYDPNRPLGQGLGGHIPEGFLAGTFILGIAAAATFLWRGSASAVSNRLRRTDLSGWDSDCWNIAHWYREG
jgi:hypothetical protein